MGGGKYGWKDRVSQKKNIQAEPKLYRFGFSFLKTGIKN